VRRVAEEFACGFDSQAASSIRMVYERQHATI
jgi:hypothetical protein